MKDGSERTNTRSLKQRKKIYILRGAFLGLIVWLLPILVLSILSLEQPLSLALIVGFSTVFLSPFIGATTLLGGLIGYWIWKAKVDSGGAKGGADGG